MYSRHDNGGWYSSAILYSRVLQRFLIKIHILLPSFLAILIQSREMSVMMMTMMSQHGEKNIWLSVSTARES